MDARALLAWLDDMGFVAGDRDRVAAASRYSTGAPLRAARTNAEIARAARGAPVEAVALAGGENARRWLADLRHVRLEINGDDLLAAGVPAGAGDRRAAAARPGPQARRRDRRARAGAGDGARPGRRIGSPRMSANVLQWDGGPGPLRGLLPLGHRSAQRHGPVDPLHDALGAGRADFAGECALWFMAMDRDGDALRAQGDPSDRRADRPARPVPAHAGRRRPVRPRHGGRLRGRRVGALVGAVAAGRPSTSTRCCGAPASPRPSSCSPTRTSRSSARCASPAASSSWRAPAADRRTCGAPSTRRAGRGRTPTTCAAPRASRDRAPTSTASASSCRASGASSGRARRWSDASAATTSARRARCSVARNSSRFGLTSWRFEARDGRRRVVGEVDAPRELARRRDLPRPRRGPGLLLQQRGGLDAPQRLGPHVPRALGWVLRDTLVADGNAHFEYAQRAPVDGVELLVT